MTNPYTPPGAPVGDPPEGKRRSPLGAVALGFFADVAGTMLFSFAATTIVAITLVLSGTAPDAVTAALEDMTGLKLINLAGGLACTVLGGYVGARFANHAEYATAFAVGLVSLVFGEATLIAFAHDVPLWQRLAGDVLVIPAALVGGHVRYMRKARPAPAA
jgi:hypothetical protein